MTDREKQIEEMAKDIRIVNELQASDKYMPWYSKAICLINLGYRKIPEDAVVLTKEEMKHPTRTEVIEFFVNHNEQVRKETAREIYEEINHLIIKDRTTPIWIKERFVELAKQYGVNLEE